MKVMIRASVTIDGAGFDPNKVSVRELIAKMKECLEHPKKSGVRIEAFPVNPAWENSKAVNQGLVT